jgi:hypothetical protein
MDFKKLWNNRIFRTFIQAAIGAGLGAVSNSKSVAVIITVAVSAGLAAIMPLIDEGDDQSE